jgi:hypothetical protein
MHGEVGVGHRSGAQQRDDPGAKSKCDGDTADELHHGGPPAGLGEHGDRSLGTKNAEEAGRAVAGEQVTEDDAEQGELTALIEDFPGAPGGMWMGTAQVTSGEHHVTIILCD